MFNGKRLSFEIPVNSRSGFIFKISNNRGYAEIHHADKVTQRYILQRNTT